jgi:hypothetical protein
MDAQIKQQLDNIPADALHEYVKGLQRHNYSARLDAYHSISINSMLGSSCSETDLIVLSGRHQTGSTGKANILIDSLLCDVLSVDHTVGSLLQQLKVIREPDFVATPHSSAPVFTTMQTSSTVQSVTPGTGIFMADRGGNTIEQQFLVDIRIEVTTWKHDGTPSVNTVFSWICTIEAAREFAI